MIFFPTPECFRSIRYMQYLASISATISVAVTGMYLAWSSPSVPLLTGQTEGLDFILTTEEASWVVSGYNIGLVLGCFVVGPMVEGIGRKTTLLIAAAPLFLCWMGIIFFKSFVLLLLSRIVGGFGATLALLGCCIYIGEIAGKDIRGRLGSAFSVLKLSGNLFILSVGPFISYYALAWTSSIVPVVFFVSFYYMPESPYFLVKRGELGKAKLSLLRLSSINSTKQDVEDKLKEVQRSVENDMQNKTSLKELLTNKIYRKSLVIIFGVKFLQQMSGITAIESYMQTIIEHSDSSISSGISSILFGLVQFVGAFCSALFVDRFGRKPLLFSSAIGCAVALTAEGIYFYLSNVIKADVTYLSWLPTIGIIVYLFVSSIGVYTLPNLLLGELFATNVKGNAVAIASLWSSSLSFVVTKSFSSISEAWGLHTIFWIFASVCVLGSVFVITVMPETKNKSLLEIQEKLNRHLKKDKESENSDA